MIVSGLEHDSAMALPHFTILKASAGSGKTHALTKRFVQFLMSDHIKNNQLRNVMAITFSNNAAKEMKDRILKWLKAAHFGDTVTVKELQEVVSLDEDAIRLKAGLLIDHLLGHYTDFQVKTIDSFMTTIFKASVVDLGYNPDFDILLGNDSLLEYAFGLFLRNVREGTPEGSLLESITAIVQEAKAGESSYLWDPTTSIVDELKQLYRKLSALDRQVLVHDFSQELEATKERIRDSAAALESMVSDSKLETNLRSTFPKICGAVATGTYTDLIGMGTKTVPVKKPKGKNPELQAAYETISERWQQLDENIKTFKYHYAFSYYSPYLRAYEAFSETVAKTKRQLGKVLMEDIGKELSNYLDREIVPDVYCRIGETVYHYKIDEFQDTSPVQWRNLYPLIDNSLAQGGSLFAVGDTKQAIYRFRDAEYRIMKGFEASNPFPSAQHNVRELETNYRSCKRILDFNDEVFKKVVPGNDKYSTAAALSGLNSFIQHPRDGGDGTGAVEVTVLDRDDTDLPERTRICDRIGDLVRRGYRHSDIAVLAQRNSDVVNITTWLNERGIPFISYSSLDVRRRKVTGEIIALLNFLDSPIDDLSFATFITGSLFRKVLEQQHPHITPASLHELMFSNRKQGNLYKAFQKKYPEIWEQYFASLFKSVGYLPLYDLVSDIYRMFRVFELKGEEEATFAKILEVIKDFEESGNNSLRDFLHFASEEESASEWNLDVPKTIEAVQVMTIHKSKGLGFPAVVVLLYMDTNKPFKYVLHESADGVSLLKLNRDLATCEEEFEALYEAERTNEIVSKLNSLYVGFTRAKQEMQIIGVKGEREGFPLDIISGIQLPSNSGNPTVTPTGSDKQDPVELWHHNNPLHLPVNVDDTLSIEGRRRGEFYHQVLFYVEYLDDLTDEDLRGIIKRVNRDMGEDYPVGETLATLQSFLRREGVSCFFTKIPGRTVKREQSFIDPGGHLFRMDRIIIDLEKVTVLDFKTGDDKRLEGKYVSQLANYLAILRAVYEGKTVEGLITYVDLNEERRVQ